ncbi:flagellar hook capping FlgD N-terminal domain-containing protein [Undibacterium sp. Ji49W]|uniref:flagellar hook capping FlgD N-terminal domain-containing protein n=1 Tax=Undibacterium sp. Ji49W TaxID=3413040 RepID=UPI003BF2C904
MTISSVGSTSATTNLQANSLGIQDFLKILLTQLNYQDPMKPMDNQQFMAQMAQFTTLQQTQQLNTNIEHLITNQASLQSVGLIGRTVDIATESGTFSGQVVAISLSGDAPLLTVNTTLGSKVSNIGLDQIVAVH